MNRHRLLTFPVLILALACNDAQHPTGIKVPDDPSKIIQDGAHPGGNPDFFFLFPLVPSPHRDPDFQLGTFNNRLKPSLVIEICQLKAEHHDPLTGTPTALTGCIGTDRVNPATNTVLAGSGGTPLKTFAAGSVNLVNLPIRERGWWTWLGLPPDGFYYVLWNTRQANLYASKFYRIRVLINGDLRPLGIADVDPMPSLREWKNARTGKVVQMVDNILLPIPFRVEHGASCPGTDPCAEASFRENATTTQTLQLQGEGGVGPIAAVEVPPGALRGDATFRIRRVDISGPGPIVEFASLQGSGATVCHPALHLQQFEGCFEITTIPEFAPDANGDMFDEFITVATCYERYGKENAREDFVQIWSSDVDQPPTPLPDTSAGNLLGPNANNCGESSQLTKSSNGITGYASAGLRKLQRGFGRLFGVKTAYAINKGLAGITKHITFFSPAMSAEIQDQSVGPPEVEPGGTAVFSVRVVGVSHHEHEGDGEPPDVGIPGIPVKFTLAAGGGCVADLLETEETSITDFSNSDGYASASAIITSGTCNVTVASLQATGGPLTLTATVVQPPQADLVISSGALTLTPAFVPASGGTITLSAWTISNAGATFSLEGIFDNGFYISNDAVITSSDTRLTENSNTAGVLEAGESFNWGGPTLIIPALTPGATYYIGILVDDGNAVAESNEANNYVSAPFGVLASTPPTVSAGGPYSAPEGGSVTLLPSGSDAESSISFDWDLDDNGTYETAGAVATFSAAGLDGPSTRTVRVRVTDLTGLTASAAATVNITNVAPTANLSYVGPIVQGSAVTFFYHSQIDPAASDAASFHYAFVCDGSSLADATWANSGTSTSTSCTYSVAAPSQSMRARIIDKDGGFQEINPSFVVQPSGGILPPNPEDPCVGPGCLPPCTVNCVPGVAQTGDAVMARLGSAAIREAETTKTSVLWGLLATEGLAAR